ncbi:MAG: hypothetical protein ACNS60_19855 [Candidatus Cyclobacteriaceae bacterium M2_1C_046]
MMKLLNLLSVIIFAAFISCDGQPQQQEIEVETENTEEVYSEESIEKSEDLEKEAEELDQEISEFVKDI